MNIKKTCLPVRTKMLFAHSDYSLVAMLADKRQEVRRRALDLICCSSGPEKEQNFVLPHVNPNVQEYTELKNLENKLATPPLFKGTANSADIEQVPRRFDDFLATVKPLNG